jgi:hypothetical protein
MTFLGRGEMGEVTHKSRIARPLSSRGRRVAKERAAASRGCRVATFRRLERLTGGTTGLAIRTLSIKGLGERRFAR